MAPPVKATTDERRSFLFAAGVMTAILVVLIGLFVAFYPRESEQGISKQAQVDKALTEAPHIIPTPAEGRAPENPGDPGGWEQLALFGVLILAFALIGFLIWRTSRKARAAQAARLAATPS